MLFFYFKINNNNNFKIVWDMWYEMLLLCSATKESQLWFWVEHLTPWGWRLLYQPAGGQVLEPTPPISSVLPSGGWTCSGYVLHIFCSWDGNQDSPNIFVADLQSLPKDLWKTRFGWKTACKCTMEAQKSCVVKPLVLSSKGDITFGNCIWQSKKSMEL